MSEHTTERERRLRDGPRASGAGSRRKALRRAGWATLLVVGLAVSTTCASYSLYSDCFTPSSQCLDEPAEDQESVLFLVGDAGAHEFWDNPVLQDIKRAVAALDARGVPSTVVFLGDNVYEEGLRTDNEQDLRRLAAQVEVVVGTSARGIFVPGNHDRDDRGDERGLERLMNQEQALLDFNANGANVSLIPRAGCPGPRRELLGDVRGDVRAVLVVLDTPWWMLEPETPARCGPSTKVDVMRGLERAVVEEPGLPVIVAGHHPLLSGGPHAGNAGLVRSFGNWLGLRRNDFTSPQYRDLIFQMSAAFSQAAEPVIYAAGHDHSLQVIDGTAGDVPVLHLVSGSGSKVTGAGPIPGSRFAAGLPGYMRLDFVPGGGIRLGVIAECTLEAVDANLCSPGWPGRFESVYHARVR